MPRGWYLAQGLIPLSESSSDDEEGPCELPNGQFVCGPHGMVICYKCCVDYSFLDGDDSNSDDMNRDDSDSDDSNRDNLNSDDSNRPDVPAFLSHPGTDLLSLRRGTGRVFATKFVPPSASVTPLQLFSGRRAHMFVTRYTLQNDTGTALVHTDGACLNNGQPNPRAGWGFWHGLGSSGQQLVVSGRLEKKGPFGDDSVQSSNRAELRAVIAALRLRFWPGEGFHTFVIATDSVYVVDGCTKWTRTWARNGWMGRAGPVKNKDLWEALLGEFERYKDAEMAVKFWKIPRELNTVADAAARDGASEDARNEWGNVMGLNI